MRDSYWLRCVWHRNRQISGHPEKFSVSNQSLVVDVLLPNSHVGAPHVAKQARISAAIESLTRVVRHADHTLQPDVMRRQLGGRGVNCTSYFPENSWALAIFTVPCAALVTEKVHTVKYVFIAVMIPQTASVDRISIISKCAS